MLSDVAKALVGHRVVKDRVVKGTTLAARARCSRWSKANREQINKRIRRDYAKNPEKYLARSRAWYAENKDLRGKRARAKKNPGSDPGLLPIRPSAPAPASASDSSDRSGVGSEP